jgi:predicted esterase
LSRPFRAAFFILFLDMFKKDIRVKKTARYFLSLEKMDEVEEVWFVCHGYAQLASYFIRKFEVLEKPERLIVAPEGLHRFYQSGFGGRVVASWMTSEDRQNDINDYVNYFDQVYAEVLAALKNNKVKIIVLGFSQGTASVCRWLANGTSFADTIILWAGAFPPDLELAEFAEIFAKSRIILAIGDKDEFITEEAIQDQKRLLDKYSISYEYVKFEGKHEIVPEVLNAISLML